MTNKLAVFGYGMTINCGKVENSVEKCEKDRKRLWWKWWKTLVVNDKRWRVGFEVRGVDREKIFF